MTDLAQLHERGYFRRDKIGKAFAFRPIPNLIQQLGNPGWVEPA